MSRKIRLSDPMRRWLVALLQEADPTANFTSQSDYGGATATVWALKNRGLLDRDNRLTEAGRCEARLLVSRASNQEAT